MDTWTLERTPARLQVRTSPTTCYAFTHADERNARLIAAAPDLLAALIVARDALQITGYESSLHDKALASVRAAIAKGEGGQ